MADVNIKNGWTGAVRELAQRIEDGDSAETTIADVVGLQAALDALSARLDALETPTGD